MPAAAIKSLTDLGITAGTDGTYATDDTKLGNALSASLASIGNLLGGTNGIATQISNLVDGYTKPGGLLDTINQGLQTSLSNVSTQQTALAAQLAAYSARLTAEYNAMDTAVALLKQTQTYLNAEFNPGGQRGFRHFAEQYQPGQRQLRRRRLSHMYSQRGAAQYRSVRSHGLVAEASPARLVQIMFEQILAHLAIGAGLHGAHREQPAAQ